MNDQCENIFIPCKEERVGRYTSPGGMKKPGFFVLNFNKSAFRNGLNCPKTQSHAI
jgi:hypothetical protein